MSGVLDRPTAVIGLWHLGCVTAACLAEAGHQVIAIDPDDAVVAELRAGRPPVSEPELAELMAASSGRLTYSSDPQLLNDAPRAWVAFDTPVDEEDHADVDWVLEQAGAMLLNLPAEALVVVSSQLPVGSVARLERHCAARGRADLRFACVPENLRLGQALEVFRAPERIVAGVRAERDREELADLLSPFGGEREWMGVESAEMTKHALNGFLATSVAFINEVASICETVGADAGEVARGLKSERRIGPRAYLSPGEAFAGGTLARDVSFLRALAEEHGLPADVARGVAEGNDAHKRWADRKLRRLLARSEHEPQGLSGCVVAIWGLTYKPGTDTLRRSSALELCRRLLAAGARVRAFDPAVSELPAAVTGVELCASALEASAGADALVVCTPWPELREVDPEALRESLRQAIVIDAAGFLQDSLGELAGVRYARVGRALERGESP